MKITLITLGSRGDVQPYIPLALGFQQAGYDITLTTHEIFRDFVESHGLPFAPVAANPQEVMQDEGGLKWLDTGNNPIRMMRQMRKLVGDYMHDMAKDCIAAAEDADAVLYSMLGFMVGPSLMEKLQIPGMGVYLQPLHQTSEYPFQMVPPLPDWFPAQGFFNFHSYDFVNTMTDIFFRGLLNDIREEQLGLLRYRQSFRKAIHLPYPVSYGFSPQVYPRPHDWGEHLNITGYWFLDEDFTPPAELVDWLESGEAPVYIGFGSMTSRNPGQTTEIVLEAIQKTGRRCILLSGWAGIGNSDLPDHIYKIDSIPHHWLFPQMAAIVHHGGAGTTAAALRSGKPSIVVPHFGDQFFWARRVHVIGAGTKPIHRKQLTADRLAEAIQNATRDSAMQQRAAQIGVEIEQEEGVKNAIRFFEEYTLQQPMPVSK